MTHKQHYNIYIASCDENGGIYHYRMQEDLSLEQIAFTQIDRPMYMVVENNKMYVILRAPFENAESGLIVYDLDGDGCLKNPSAITSTKGEVACHLAVDGDDVYCVNYISGSVIKMSDKVLEHVGKSVHPKRQQSAHTHFVTLTPDKKNVLVTDLGLDKVFVYDRDLNEKSHVCINKGHGPRHLEFDESGKYVFCVNELESTVSVLRYDGESLEIADTKKALPDDFSGESTAAAIRRVKNTVYTSNRGHDSVSVFDFKDGKIVLRKTVPTYGEGPRDFWVEENLIVATNEAGNCVSFVAEDSGELLKKLDIKAPLCVIIERA